MLRSCIRPATSDTLGSTAVGRGAPKVLCVVLAYAHSDHPGSSCHVLSPVQLDDELPADQSDDCCRFQALVGLQVLALPFAAERDRLRWNPEEDSPAQKDENGELVSPSATLHQLYQLTPGDSWARRAGLLAGLSRSVSGDRRRFCFLVGPHAHQHTALFQMSCIRAEGPPRGGEAGSRQQ